MKLSDRSKLIKPAVTLAVAAKAQKLKAQGVDVINFSAGEPDFDTPDRIKAAAIGALKRGMTKYTEVRGIEPLREIIAETYRREHGLDYGRDEVLVSCGAKHALYNVFQALLDPGDEVIIPTPYWVSYADMARLAGAEPKFLPTTDASGFKITPEQLGITLGPRARAFVLNSPCNPTGAAYSKAELTALGRVLEGHSCVIIADVIYDKIVYDGFRAENIVRINPKLRDRTVILNGVSKTYAMTGWRIGYALGPTSLIAAAAKIQSQSTSNPTSIAQAAALEAIRGPQEEVAAMVAEFQKRRDVIVTRLNSIRGVGCFNPQGAFYVFPNIRSLLGKKGGGKIIQGPGDLADYLLEEARVAGVPGEDFGSNDHIRFSYGASLEDVQEGCERIAAALEKLA